MAQRFPVDAEGQQQVYSMQMPLSLTPLCVPVVDSYTFTGLVNDASTVIVVQEIGHPICFSKILNFDIASDALYMVDRSVKFKDLSCSHLHNNVFRHFMIKPRYLTLTSCRLDLEFVLLMSWVVAQTVRDITIETSHFDFSIVKRIGNFFNLTQFTIITSKMTSKPLDCFLINDWTSLNCLNICTDLVALFKWITPLQLANFMHNRPVGFQLKLRETTSAAYSTVMNAFKSIVSKHFTLTRVFIEDNHKIIILSVDGEEVFYKYCPTGKVMPSIFLFKCSTVKHMYNKRQQKRRVSYYCRHCSVRFSGGVSNWDLSRHLTKSGHPYAL